MNYEQAFEDLKDFEERALSAQREAAGAFNRLLTMAEKSETGQSRVVAEFVASCFDGRAFELFELRAVDVSISDDMLRCLDGLRWAKADLHLLVPDGVARIDRMCAARGLAPAPDASDRP